MQFKAFTPDVEVSGKAILAVIEGTGRYKSFAERTLEKHGINVIDPEGWYLHQSWLNTFKGIYEEIGAKVLFEIGLKVPSNAFWPLQVKDIKTALSSVNVVYHMNHRLAGEVLFDSFTGKLKEGIGHYDAKIVSNREMKMTCNNPYPCDFDRGIITAVAEKHKESREDIVRVIHEEPLNCRSIGGVRCIYTVKW